jgi:hypothetical protein
VLVTYACNPSYSGGRDQEDEGLKPALANSLRTLSQKNPSQKMVGAVAQGVALSSSPSTTKKKKSNMNDTTKAHVLRSMLNLEVCTAIENTNIF